MAAKHSVRVFGTARFILSFATAILVMLVVWIAVRAVGPVEAVEPPAAVALPSTPPVKLAAPPPTRSSPSASASAKPRTTKSPTPSRTPARARTSAPVPKKTSQPPAETDVEATLSVGASWDEGYVAAVRVTNEGDQAVDWKVTVSHADLRDLQLRGVWNATGNVSGDSIVFTGGRLEPGRTASFGYQTSKAGRGKARPAACNAVGGSCRIR